VVGYSFWASTEKGANRGVERDKRAQLWCSSPADLLWEVKTTEPVIGRQDQGRRIGEIWLEELGAEKMETPCCLLGNIVMAGVATSARHFRSV
jgi:hypothetical protein